MPDVVQFEVDNHIAIIRLNRPEAMNTFTSEMGHAWSAAYQRCDDDDNIRVVVVTGNGRAFCAGADMRAGAATFDEQQDMTFRSTPITPAYQIRKPVIAALNGHAIGIGFSLALQCDFRIVANEAKYGLLQVRRGVLADGCSHWLLPRLVGVEKTLDIILCGDYMDGQCMLANGLASQSVAAEAVFEVAMAKAASLAKNSSPLIAAMSKRLIWESLDMSLDSMEQKETAWLHHSMGLADAVEGGSAFMEKRLPEWSGSVAQQWPDKEK